jgi:hypothetical protein
VDVIGVAQRRDAGGDGDAAQYFAGRFFFSSFAITERRMFSATLIACRSAVSGSTTTNSSPP